MAKTLMEIINDYTDEEGYTKLEDVKNDVCPDLPTSELYQHYDNLDIRIVIDWSEWYKSFSLIFMSRGNNTPTGVYLTHSIPVQRQKIRLLYWLNCLLEAKLMSYINHK